MEPICIIMDISRYSSKIINFTASLSKSDYGFQDTRTFNRFTHPATDDAPGYCVRFLADYCPLRHPHWYPFFRDRQGALMVITALPFLHWLADLNNAIKLPEFMSSVEEWMRESERKAEEMTELFINVKTYPAFLVNLVMIAVLPAIGEELLFRGVILRFLKEWTGKVHLAVLLSAFIFSTLHFQFYGFFPRFLLGVLLGYMFIWSGSLWVPILVHFINNGTAVIIMFLANRAGRTAELEDIGSTSNAGYIIGSAVMIILMTWVIYYAEKKRKYRNNDTSLKQL